MRKTLAEVDLTPLSVTEINLLGTSVPETFSHFGTCHGSKCADWTPELGATLKAAYEAAEKIVNGAKKPEMIAFLASRGRVCWAEEKRNSLRASCMLAISEARHPVRFVNVAPNEWICGCGHTGPATYRAVSSASRVHIPVCGGEGCTRPHYTMQLVAMRNWVRGVFEKKTG